MTKIDALLRTLDALVNANNSGYHCNSEMSAVISALLDELKAPADVYESGGKTTYVRDPHTTFFLHDDEWVAEVNAVHPNGDSKKVRIDGEVEIRVNGELTEVDV